MSLTAAHIAASTIQPKLEEALSGLVAGVWYGRVPTDLNVESFAKPWVVYQLEGVPAEDFERDRMEYTLRIGVRVLETKATANAALLAVIAAVRSLSRWAPETWPTGVTGSALRQTADAGRGFEGAVVEDGFDFTFHAETAAGG